MARRRRSWGRDLDAILLVDKPAGPTSNEVVVRLRRALGARKAGHCGSLDPPATGLLPICFGRATAVSAFLLDADKTYAATARFGAATTTLDATGDVVRTAGTEHLDEARVRRATERFVGDIEQIPPMVSALKKDGVRLHELARAGEEVEREPRAVRIERFELLAFRPVGSAGVPEADFEIRCSKGTYIRTLLDDLGTALDCAAHTALLRRTGVGPWRAPLVMHDLEEVERLCADGGWRGADALLLELESGLADLPVVDIDGGEKRWFVHGNPIALDVERLVAAGTPRLSAERLVRVRGPLDGDVGLLGVGRLVDEGEETRLWPARVLAPEEAENV
jgi:tRNA pseudouridine55 synthase